MICNIFAILRKSKDNKYPLHAPLKNSYVYVEIPRKNGKTTLCALIALLHALVGDAEGCVEVCIASNTKDQSKLIYDACCKFIHTSKQQLVNLDALQEKIKVTVLYLIVRYEVKLYLYQQIYED